MSVCNDETKIRIVIARFSKLITFEGHSFCLLVYPLVPKKYWGLTLPNRWTNIALILAFGAILTPYRLLHDVESCFHANRYLIHNIGMKMKISETYFLLCLSKVSSLDDVSLLSSPSSKRLSTASAEATWCFWMTIYKTLVLSQNARPLSAQTRCSLATYLPTQWI